MLTSSEPSGSCSRDIKDHWSQITTKVNVSSRIQLFLTLWTVCSLPGSPVHRILQARRLEWVAISFSRDLSNPGMEPVSLMSPALAARFFTTSATWEAPGDLDTSLSKIHRWHINIWKDAPGCSTSYAKKKYKLKKTMRGQGIKRCELLCIP